MLFLILLLIGCSSPTAGDDNGNRIPLHPDRVPHWKSFTEYGRLNKGPYFGQPEQVHISYGGDPSCTYITWLTFDDTEESVVEYGTDYLLAQRVFGTVDYFVDNGTERVKRYTHRALIENIEPGVRYFYHVGSKYGWSSIFSFVGLKERPEGGFKFAVYGDMGNVNARSLGKIQRLAQMGDFDMVLHVGDLAYNLDTDQGYFGDEFMRQLEPVAAYVPYQVVVGNHEQAYNFTHYINRYTMPNTRDNLFYSFDVGYTHFIAFSTEFYFFWKEYGFEQLVVQWKWLLKDLKKANANREKVPWIIVMGHRPMYCSDFDSDDCTRYNSIKANANRANVPWIVTLGHRSMYCSDYYGNCEHRNRVIRTGLPGIHAYALEKLFYKYGVDLEIWAHEHTFERMYAVYNRTVYNGSRIDEPYLNPPAPVHIVTGSAGCQENTDTFVTHPKPWSAFRSSNYGFSQMHIYNKTHLHFEQVLAAEDVVEDQFWLVKDTHGPYTKTDLGRLTQLGFRVPDDYCHPENEKCKQKRRDKSR